MDRAARRWVLTWNPGEWQGRAEWPRAKLWTVRVGATLAGGVLTGLAAWFAAGLWGTAATSVGLTGRDGRFVVHSCQEYNGGRGGKTTMCRGSFTSADGRMVVPGSLQWPAGAGKAEEGAGLDVRRTPAGVLVPHGAVEAIWDVVLAAAVSVGAGVLGLATVFVPRRAGFRERGVPTPGSEVPAARRPRPPAYGYRKRGRDSRRRSGRRG